MKWKDIPKEITSRVKLRSDNEQYFDDEFQGIPSHGYTQMFEEMLSGISVHLDCDQHEWRNYPSDMTVWTGKIDEYFDYCYGSLDFRSLTFVYKVEPRRTHHVINECTADIPYTRSCDHSFWLKQHNPLTIISYEYPCAYKQSHFKDKDTNVPFYPIPTTKNLQILEWYQKLAQKEKTIFVGRLATYKYINMDEVILQVMEKIQWKPSP
jgi:UDP-galactopyranose mutase